MIIQRDQARDIRAKYRWRQGVTPQEPRARAVPVSWSP